MTPPAIAALRRSHEHLKVLVEPMPLDQLAGPSYDAGWTIAHVLSHLGSGAVIGQLTLDAALATAPAPAPEQFQAVWDEWNAKDPKTQAVDALHADESNVAAWEALDADRIAGLRGSLGSWEIDGPTMLGMRLAEHALHTWDVAVTLDESALVDAAAVDQIVDGLAMIVGFSGKPQGGPEKIVVETTAPERRFVLDVGDSVALRPAIVGDGPATVELPAEAFVRLVYGRLDPAHTPSGVENTEVARLRAMFPGI